MPVDKTRYPADWPEISLRIRLRANHCCERCGVPNGAVGYRDNNDVFHEMRREEADALKLDVKIVRIVLTVAHLGTPGPDGSPGDPRDKMDCRDANLAALCQMHHLRQDIDEHRSSAAATRRRKIIQAGQMELPIGVFK